MPRTLVSSHLANVYFLNLQNDINLFMSRGHQKSLAQWSKVGPCIIGVDHGGGGELYGHLYIYISHTYIHRITWVYIGFFNLLELRTAIIWYTESKIMYIPVIRNQMQRKLMLTSLSCAGVSVGNNVDQ